MADTWPDIGGGAKLLFQSKQKIFVQANVEDGDIVPPSPPVSATDHVSHSKRINLTSILKYSHKVNGILQNERSASGEEAQTT